MQTGHPVVFVPAPRRPADDTAALLEAELALLLAHAARSGDAREHGRQVAETARRRLVTGLAACAGALAAFDAALLALAG